MKTIHLFNLETELSIVKYLRQVSLLCTQLCRYLAAAQLRNH